MAKTDMRWLRTERHIMEAFAQALTDGPIDKISVTALSREADINKATFYLHYRDVYDLAGAYARRIAEAIVEQMEYLDDFLDNPDQFVRRFIEDFEAFKEHSDALVSNGLYPVFMDHLVTRMDKRLQEKHPVGGGVHGEIVLSFVVGGFFAAMGRFGGKNKDELFSTLTHLMSSIDDYGRLRFGS